MTTFTITPDSPPEPPMRRKGDLMTYLHGRMIVMVSV